MCSAAMHTDWLGPSVNRFYDEGMLEHVIMNAIKRRN